MGLEQRDPKVFLRISAGKIRMPSDESDPQAEERYTEIDGKYHYERVFNSCTGYLRKVAINTHEEFGTSYSLELYDPDEMKTFSLSMGEKSRYFQSLCQHFPNFDFSLPLTVKPYQFKSDGKNRIGISFKHGDEKVENYYREVVDESTDPPTVEACNGLEQFTFSDDKDENQIELLRMMKFLKGELKKGLIELEQFVEDNPLPGKTTKPAPSADEPEEDDQVEEKPKKKPAKKAPAKKAPAKTTATKRSPAKKAGGRGSKKKDNLPY